MDTINLQDIMNLARQESARLYHYFIGVEHLFIGLTKLNGGLTNAVLEYHNLSPRFVRYSIRETVGRYENRRHWPGFPETPRVVHLLNLAAQHAKGNPISERDLLLAIFDENDNVVIRVLNEMGADTAALRETAAGWDAPLAPQRPEVKVLGQTNLEAEQRQVLQLMFHDYSQVEIMRDLNGGYSGARVLLVRPIRPSGQRDAPVVVKLDDRHSILYERRRYDQYVKGTLPASAARLLDAPVVPDNTWCGGLKYTFVGNVEDSEPLSLRHLAARRDPQQLSSFLRALFDVFGPAWWLQNQPYRFGVWREYEHVLPPALVVDILPDAKLGAAGQVLTPLGTWSRGNYVLPGEVVALNGFVVQKVDAERDVLHLAAGAQPEAINRSGKVEVRGLGVRRGTYFRGEVVDMLIGRVVSTRDDLLRRSLLSLEPEFDLRADLIPSGHPSVPELPNPTRRVSRLLEQQVNGYLSTIHGDLHLSNVLVGPRGDPWLIDFAWTREGHTLFDWALLEISLLIDAISQTAPPGWFGRWQVIALLHAINRGDDRMLREQTPLVQAMLVVRTIREIVARCLVIPDKWEEYYVALALLALRAMDWHTVGQDGQRLAFLVAALSVAASRVSEDIPTAADPTTWHGPGNDPTLDQSGLYD
ncbi:MAG: phosphotransferase [Chloroflexi bacterium]|nr:phosphotransferase [Chloroflexota bacterium]